MFILHHSYQTEVSRGSKRLITCDEKIIEHSKNDRYRCVRRGIGIDTMRAGFRENYGPEIRQPPSSHIHLPLPPLYRRFTVGGHPRAFIYFHAVRMPHVASSPDFRARASSETKRGKGALQRVGRGICEGARVREG